MFNTEEEECSRNTPWNQTQLCLAVESSVERVERSVRKKDPKRSAAKESLKGSRKEVCQKERERTTLSRVERKGIFTRFQKWKFVKKDRSV